MQTKPDNYSAAKNIAITAMCILIAVYISAQYLRGASARTETVPAVLITHRRTVEATGYILRDEIVLSSDAPGYALHLVDDGAKVTALSSVARIYSSGDYASAQRINASLERRIRILKESSVNTEYSAVSREKADEEINRIYINILSDVAAGNVAGASAKYDELLIWLNRRQVVTFASSGFGAQIAALEAEREANAAWMAGGRVTEVVTHAAGNFYSSVDGYEGIFTPGTLNGMTPSSFIEFTSAAKPREYGRAVGKVVTDYKWSLACAVGREKGIEFTEGKIYDLIFPLSGGRRLTAELAQVRAETDTGLLLLIFNLTVSPQWFSFERAQPIEINILEVTGLKVPEQAVRYVDIGGRAVTGVYVRRRGMAVFKELPESDLLAAADGFFVYRMAQPGEHDYNARLNLNEEIVVGGKNVVDGAVLR